MPIASEINVTVRSGPTRKNVGDDGDCCGQDLGIGGKFGVDEITCSRGTNRGGFNLGMEELLRSDGLVTEEALRGDVTVAKGPIYASY